MTEEEMVVLVDEQDRPIGLQEKLQAHVEGRLHRAISVFLFNDKGEMLLQRRSFSKYHSGGLWTNACCSHPRAGEELQAAATRRLKEEMGIEVSVEKVFDFIYQVSLEKGLTEHEFDHVFVGIFNEEPVLNLDEADDWKWISPEELELDVTKHPENYTAWFKMIFKKVITSAIGSCC